MYRGFHVFNGNDLTPEETQTRNRLYGLYEIIKKPLRIILNDMIDC